MEELDRDSLISMDNQVGRIWHSAFSKLNPLLL